MKTTLRTALVITLLLAAARALPAAGADRLLKIDTRPGVTVSFWYMPRPGATATVVLLPGGSGGIGFKHGVPTSQNFLVRSRDLFAAQGFLVAVVDRPSDWAGADKDTFRVTPAHAEDAAAIARALRQEATAPVWFIGTSRGTISVANIASRVGGDLIQGIVLTSSVTSPGKRNLPSVPDVDVGGVAVPVLVLGHGDDDCYVTPWPEQEALVKRFKGSPSVEAIRIDGGDAGNFAEPCGPFSHHGFLGQEKAVVERIAVWIRGHQR